MPASSLEPTDDSTIEAPSPSIVTPELRERLDRGRRFETELLRAQKLDGLSALTGGVAHEFNNLLAVILGNAGLAQRSLPEGDPAREKLDNVITATKAGGELIGQMLAYAGKGHVELGPVDINELFATMGHLLDTAVPKGAFVDFDLAPDLPMVFGDSSLLQQVALNLVTNAGDALVDGQGTVTVRTSIIDAGEGEFESAVIEQHLSAGRYVACEVTDTGEGFTSAVRSRMFEPFFSTRFAGRGLGLSSVLGIVRSHGGSIQVVGEQGAGTTIRVLLPTTDIMAPAPVHDARLDRIAVAEPAETTDRTPAPVAGAADRPVVLVVDDDRAMRLLCTRALEGAGFAVLTAGSGAEAVERFGRSDRVDAVLLDLTMPGMTGQETRAALLAIDASVRIVLMSGYSASEVGEWFTPGPLTEFISKPFDLDDLVVVLRRVLAQPASPSDEQGVTEDGDVINVLVVDDHEMVGQAFASIVEEAPNMRIAGIVADGEHALLAIEREPVDVVLMDYNLPTADGIEWASEVKARRPDIKVLILTGSTGDTKAIIARAVNEGCDGFLSKASSIDGLVKAINRVHAGDPVFTSGELVDALRLIKSNERRSPFSLTEREIEVLQLMASGASAAELGRQLYISVHTVRTHIRHLLEKLEAHSKLEAVAIAVNQGIITMPQPNSDR